ncbi:hypothetical protein L1987_87934 [Smallanthus sonchifolius]|nr:hypothetical protein L1987_87934 [Smallanthus sonchifolius]
MGDAVFDKAPEEEEEAEDIEETEEELDEEEAHVITRDDDLDILTNLSRKHNEQIPGDCLCFGCFLHCFDFEDDDVVLLFYSSSSLSSESPSQKFHKYALESLPCGTFISYIFLRISSVHVITPRAVLKILLLLLLNVSTKLLLPESKVQNNNLVLKQQKMMVY